jgi:RNA polymerase-binding transcription factor DksA
VERLKELKAQDPFQDPDHVTDNADPGSESREEDGHDRIQAQVDELTAEQTAIEKALGKIAAGTYGICEVTGQNIPRERLFAMPTASTIVGAS